MYKKARPQWNVVDGKLISELVCVAFPRPWQSRYRFWFFIDFLLKVDLANGNLMGVGKENGGFVYTYKQTRSTRY